MLKLGLICFLWTFGFFTSLAQFSGGSGDGISSLKVSSLPLSASNTMYSGGDDDGITSIRANSQSLSIANNGFSGGDNDGSSSIIASSISLNASSQFSGGTDDGASMTNASAQLFSATTMFTGGEDDGFNSYSSLGLALDATSNYAGGDDDGTSALLISGLDLSMNSMFNGGIDDGFANITANALDVSTEGMYAGGFDDGYGNATAPGIKIVVLSIIWNEFTVTRNGLNAMLHWEVGNERNSVGFDIERSFDGAHFSKIGFVNAENNTQTAHQYNYIDSDPGHFNPSTNYSEVFYRLRQLDMNQKFSFSPIRNLQLNISPAIFSIYPNPTASLLSIWVNSIPGSALSYDLQLFDNNGMLIMQQKEIKTNLHELNVKKLSAGTYYLKLYLDNHIYSYPVIVIH